ncbi:hypothetical protein FKM82_004078 [Ascaphus truei]
MPVRRVLLVSCAGHIINVHSALIIWLAKVTKACPVALQAQTLPTPAEVQSAGEFGHQSNDWNAISLPTRKWRYSFLDKGSFSGSKTRFLLSFVYNFPESLAAVEALYAKR